MPRNTLDTKAKYEHYFRKDIDVFILWFSLIPMRQIKLEEIILETQDLVGLQDFLLMKKSTKWLRDLNMILQSNLKR